MFMYFFCENICVKIFMYFFCENIGTRGLCIFETNMCLDYDVFYLEKTLGLEVYVFLL